MKTEIKTVKRKRQKEKIARQMKEESVVEECMAGVRFLDGPKKELVVQREEENSEVKTMKMNSAQNENNK